MQLCATNLTAFSDCMKSRKANKDKRAIDTHLQMHGCFQAFCVSMNLWKQNCHV